MTTLSVHTFDTAQAAQRRIGRLESTSGRRTVADDAAVISWPDDADRPTAWLLMLSVRQTRRSRTFRYSSHCLAATPRPTSSLIILA